MSETTTYQFETIDHALRWSTEVLRGRRFPKIGRFYLESVDDEGVQEFCGHRSDMPKTAEDRLCLALEVQKAVDSCLEQEEKAPLTAYYWGDYTNDAIYQKAASFQERMRREGVRVKLNYRYSFRQLGRLLEVSDKTAAKIVRSAQEKIEEELAKKGLLPEKC